MLNVETDVTVGPLLHRLAQKAGCVYTAADFLGRTYTYPDAQAHKAIPLALVPGGQVTRAIAKGEMLTEDNFAPDTDKFVYKLRRMQDEQLEMEA